MTPTSAHLGDLISGFRISLLAENKSPGTLKIYLHSARRLVDYLERQGLSTNVADITRQHVEGFLTELRQTHSPNTCATYYRSLGRFFKWCAEEDEIVDSPMRNMRAPKVPEKLVPIVLPEDVERIFKVCQGKDFTSRRDMAILRMLESTGMRCGELTALTVDDIDLEHLGANVIGKGKRPRFCPFTPETGKHLLRYLRTRSEHPSAHLKQLWLGPTGAISDGAVLRMVKRRGEQAGVPNLHPHRFRHSYAHDKLSRGMQEVDLMRLAGWRSRTMLSRYGAAAADDRAHDAYRRLTSEGRL